MRGGASIYRVNAHVNIFAVVEALVSATNPLFMAADVFPWPQKTVVEVTEHYLIAKHGSHPRISEISVDFCKDTN